jgi:hypothetical protein
MKSLTTTYIVSETKEESDTVPARRRMLSLLLILFAFGYSAGKDEIKVEVYYGSLCPFSRSFITDQEWIF